MSQLVLGSSTENQRVVSVQQMGELNSLTTPPFNPTICQKAPTNCSFDQTNSRPPYLIQKDKVKEGPLVSPPLELLKKPVGVPFTSTEKEAIEIHHLTHQTPFSSTPGARNPILNGHMPSLYQVYTSPHIHYFSIENLQPC